MGDSPLQLLYVHKTFTVRQPWDYREPPPKDYVYHKSDHGLPVRSPWDQRELGGVNFDRITHMCAYCCNMQTSNYLQLWALLKACGVWFPHRQTIIFCAKERKHIQSCEHPWELWVSSETFSVHAENWNALWNQNMIFGHLVLRPCPGELLCRGPPCASLSSYRLWAISQYLWLIVLGFQLACLSAQHRSDPFPRPATMGKGAHDTGAVATPARSVPLNFAAMKKMFCLSLQLIIIWRLCRTTQAASRSTQPVPKAEGAKNVTVDYKIEHVNILLSTKHPYCWQVVQLPLRPKCLKRRLLWWRKSSRKWKPSSLRRLQ